MIDKLKEFCLDAIIEKKSILHKQINVDLINISVIKEYKFGHFQLNNSILLAKLLDMSISDLYDLLLTYLPSSMYNNKISITFSQPCFINFILNISFIEYEVKKILNYKIDNKNIEKIILDYSSPNIAKEMHVGHLRSTIIGECLANLFKNFGHKLIKINHLGDWGTQFGMLIAYIKLKHAKNLVFTLKDLSKYYKKAQFKFVNNLKFALKSKKEVIKLQNEESFSLNLWRKITKISKIEYEKIYKLLDVNIQYKGESFYNKMLKSLIILLTKKKLIVISKSALCIYIDGFKNQFNESLPLIVQKADGGFNYATTELAALYYRITYHKPDKIIYITDIGQKNHFQMIFKAVNIMNIKNNNTKLIHIAFGLMLNTDGKKIKTRSGKTEKLITLITKSMNFSAQIIRNKMSYMSKKQIAENSKKLGINTIRYADLSNKIDQNYIFDYKKMLRFNGNTASFLVYAYVRIMSIFCKFNKNKLSDIKHDSIHLVDKTEIDLALHLLQYYYIIKKSMNDLNPNLLTSYLYNLAEKFHVFFELCPIINSDLVTSRLLLCEITRIVLKSGFDILGLKTINKM